MAGELDEALVRARHLQVWLDNMGQAEDPWRRNFFAALPAEVKREIEGAARLDWLPAAYHALFADLVAAAFGPVRSHDYYRRAIARELRSPFWEGVVRAGVRLLGLNPGTFLRWVAKGWESSFKNCGALHGELVAPLRGRLLYERLPSVLSASDAWLDSAQGSVYGVFDLCGVSGVVRLDKRGRGEGRLVVELEWVDAVGT
jgi:hypothetical protein